MTQLYEMMGACRSGHHLTLNWIIRNQTGLQSEWKYKLLTVGKSGLHLLSEANKDVEYGFDLLINHQPQIKTLFVGYEDTKPDYTMFRQDEKFYGPNSLNRFENFEFVYKARICFIRDFFNTLSSRLKSNEEKFFKVYNSDEPMMMDVGQYFIDMWKCQAIACIDNKISYLKFEDLLSNKEIREKFLWDNFGIKDIFGIEGVKGTKSSFGETKDVDKRYKMIEIPEETKQLIRQDIELRELIDAMGYKYQPEILI